MVRNIGRGLSVAAFLLGLAGCSGDRIPQGALCLIETDAENGKCTPGELIYVQPPRWGSEQLPLRIAAAYCDFNHPIVQNNSGVICVFTDERLDLLDEDAK